MDAEGVGDAGAGERLTADGTTGSRSSRAEADTCDGLACCGPSPSSSAVSVPVTVPTTTTTEAAVTIAPRRAARLRAALRAARR
ncbi:hypothetical protein [Streptomyces gossypiisoli]|uniref:hypothetical protein n=1 Tax=Streptomyces gossypiisoli TaxID=2748864 RepID=UPI0038CD6828